MTDTEMHPFEYAVLRAVPRVERGEFVNVGIALYCQQLDYLGCATHLDVDRLKSLDRDVDVEAVTDALRAVETICCGGPAAGAAAEVDIGKRFRWLTAPRSTIIQPGPIHTGLTADPADRLHRLTDDLVG